MEWLTFALSASYKEMNLYIIIIIIIIIIIKNICKAPKSKLVTKHYILN